jgi:hypothetical protein
VADDRDERVRCSAHQALRLRLGVEAELAVVGDDVGDRLPDPGKLAQPVFGDDAVKRLDQRREPVRGAPIGFDTQ